MRDTTESGISPRGGGIANRAGTGTSPYDRAKCRTPASSISPRPRSEQTMSSEKNSPKTT